MKWIQYSLQAQIYEFNYAWIDLYWCTMIYIQRISVYLNWICAYIDL